MQTDDVNMHVFQNRNWCSPKSDWLFFFYLWLSKDLSIVRIFSEKKYGRTELLSEKTEALYAELNGRVEEATSSNSATGDFSHYVYSVFVAKNHQEIRSSSLVHEFSFTNTF